MIRIGRSDYNHCKCGRRKRDIARVCIHCAIENKKLVIGHISIKYGYRFIKVRDRKWMTEHRENPYVLNCRFIDAKKTRFKSEEEAKEYAQKFLCYLISELTEQ
jgi:hypothetical protein